MEIKFTTQAAFDLDKLPMTIARRFDKVYKSLKCWPEVSGCKPLKANFSGYYRKRFGDYRVIFKIQDETMVIDKIAHRKEVYE